MTSKSRAWAYFCRPCVEQVLQCVVLKHEVQVVEVLAAAATDERIQLHQADVHHAGDSQAFDGVGGRQQRVAVAQERDMECGQPQQQVATGVFHGHSTERRHGGEDLAARRGQKLIGLREEVQVDGAPVAEPEGQGRAASQVEAVRERLAADVTENRAQLGRRRRPVDRCQWGHRGVRRGCRGRSSSTHQRE